MERHVGVVPRARLRIIGGSNWCTLIREDTDPGREWNGGFMQDRLDQYSRVLDLPILTEDQARKASAAI